MRIEINGTFDSPGDNVRDALLRLAIRLKQMAFRDEPDTRKDGWKGDIKIVETKAAV
jgi:hypothetical protein